MPRKRILEIIPTLDRAGAEKQLLLLAAGLPRDEFDVHVCVLTRLGPLWPDYQAAGIPVTVVGKPWKFDPLALVRLTRLVRRLKPDLVHTWIFAANAYGRVAARLAGVACVVAGERCVDLWKGGLELTIDRWLARRTACIVANSGAIRDFYVARGLPEEKFEVIPNGIAWRVAGPAPREQVLAELGLPRTARLIALVGRLWPQKRVQDAIWAMDLLRIYPYDLHLLVVGDGPQRRQLERLSVQVDRKNHIHFLGQRADVPRWLPHCEMLWSPSAFEGQSNAILEAMAAGLPVVATDIPGTRDLVVHGQTGFLIPTPPRAAQMASINDVVVRGLCRYTRQLLEKRDLARQLGAAGRQRALSEFSVERMVERYAALYRRLLDRQPPGLQAVAPLQSRPEPAIDGDHLPRDEIGLRRHQKASKLGHVLRRPPAVAEGFVASPLLPILGSLLRPARPNPSWGQAIHSHLGR